MDMFGTVTAIDGFSFPSGHATRTAMVVCFMLSQFSPWPWTVAILLWAVAVPIFPRHAWPALRHGCYHRRVNWFATIQVHRPTSVVVVAHVRGSASADTRRAAHLDIVVSA